MNAKDNTLLIVGICKRMAVAPKAWRRDLVAELAQALDEESGASASAEVKEAFVTMLAGSPTDCAIANLRDALTWPEVRENSQAIATICRSLRQLREAA